jgi:hypothetical protein
MNTIKKVALYLDHFTANIFEYEKKAILLKTIESAFKKYEKDKVSLKGVSHLHHKEQALQNAFYLKLREELKVYNDVLLFGSTSAKIELKNILNNDNRFNDVTITIKNTDKLTKKQQIAFIKEIFYID